MIEVIAEVGVNHNGDVELAKKLINISHEIGANTVKFQTFNPDELVTADAPLANYQLRHLEHMEHQQQLLSKLALSTTDFYSLRDHSLAVGIDFLSTPFELSSLQTLLELGLKRIKISSGNLSDVPLLKEVAASGVEIILSTGMSNFNEIDLAIDALFKGGCCANSLTLLHCTSAYPAPLAELNLAAINAMKQRYNVAVGYSDHTDSPFVPALAVMAGATIIEKHLTLDRAMIGPDHAASLDPQQFQEMIELVRAAEKAIGKPLKSRTRSEEDVYAVARKSIVAAKNIKKGETLTDRNICLKRPGLGLSGFEWDRIVNLKASKSYTVGDYIDE